MTDVYSGHSQFILLTEDNRRRWFDSRTLFLLLVITAPIVIFCGVYAIILKGNESLLYPKSYVQVPSNLIHRAKAYSNHIKQYKRNELVVSGDNNENSFNELKLVCYYCFPSNDPNALQPNDIDPNLCTHIIVGFASIVNNSIELSASEIKTLKSVVNLKVQNENLKVLLSIGGAGDDKGFGPMVLKHETRKHFIQSAFGLAANYQIDGIDLDWEFPNQNSSFDKHQSIHFIQLLEEIRARINKHHNKHKFLLTVAVAAPVVIVENSYYSVSYIDKFVDFVNVMTYDFHFFTKFTPFTGFNAPLFASSGENGYLSTLNINYSTHYWASQGMSRDKIMVGLPTYAHTFRLTNPNNKGPYAPARGYGKLGSDGFADYTQVCKFLNLNQISPIFDLDSKSPYAVKGVEWVSFENEQSLLFKAEFIRDYQFGGAMVFALNSDDHMGVCQIDPHVPSQSFPLIKKIQEVFNKNYSIF